MLFAATLAIGVAANAAAEPIQVPGDVPTIQDAIDSAKPGDEIWVEPGEYAGFSVTVPRLTISGDNEGKTEITDEIVVEEAGVELHNLHIADRVRTFDTMTATKCHIENRGMQILSITEGPVTLTECVFSNCTGGALGLLSTDAVLSKCVFDSNTTDGNGAAISLSDICTLIAEDCHFINNRAAGTGGAIAGSECGTIDLVRCHFEGNEAGANGGAFGAYADVFSADRCTFVGNTAGAEGAAIHLIATPCFGPPGPQRISNSRFEQNVGTTVISFAPDPTATYQITRSTLCQNSAQETIRGEWEGDHVVISTTCCRADVDRDGQVTPSDLNAWIEAYEDLDPHADQNNDGVIDPTDFTKWLDNYHTGCAG